MKTLTSVCSLTFFVSLFFTLTAPAQVSPEVEELFYQGYLTSSQTPWEQALTKIEQNTSLTDDQRLTAVTEAQIGLLNYAMANQDEDAFDEVADALEENLEKLLKQDKKNALAQSRLAQLYSSTIAFSPYKAMYLGPKSEGLVDKALKYDPTCPNAWVQRGGAQLFTPAMFGGDKEEAVRSFQKAVQYFEEQGDTNRSWQYLNALAWLGQAHQQAGQTSDAVAVFQKALEVEPEFGWVKYQLLPEATAQSAAQ